jgi:putative ABC transport system permease protein
VSRVIRLLLKIAPPPFRAEYGADVVRTIGSVCRAAYQRGGALSAARAGFLEVIDLLRSAVRSRLGRKVAITAGSPRPQPGDRRRRSSPLAVLLQDLRLAIRSLAASRTHTAIVVTTLALGIGVNSAVFSILDSILLTPMPFASADRLSEIWNFDTVDKFGYPGFSRAVLLEWRKQTDLFDRVEAFDATGFVYAGPRGAELISGTVVTPGLLPMLGVRPLAGRLFADGDGRGGTERLVVISERFWRGSLGGDPHAVGRSIPLNGAAYEIIGVTPAGFRFPNEPQQFWVPYDAEAPPPGPARGRMVALSLRRSDVPFAFATDRVRERGAAINKAAGLPSTTSADLNNRGQLVDVRTRRSLGVLAASVGFLLLIVCANLASLSLARLMTRARDAAVKAALGASRGDLVREALIESLLLGAIGAAAGLAVAALALKATVASLPDVMTIGTMNPIDLDGRAVAFTAAIGMLTALLFGLPPALIGSRPGIVDALKRESRASSGSTASRRLRAGLVVAEVALSLVLLVGAALMARSFMKLEAIDKGFDTRGLIQMSLGFPGPAYLAPAVRDEFTATMVARVATLPGVTGASAGGVPPSPSMIRFGAFEVSDRPGERSAQTVMPVYDAWPNYFATLGLPIKDGRAFDPHEPSDSIIVSDSFARKNWPGRSAVGGRFRIGTDVWRTIVGVAGEVQDPGHDAGPGDFEFYRPLQQPEHAPPPAAKPSAEPIVAYRDILVRASDPAATVDRLRQILTNLDPRVVVWKTSLVDHLFADAIARPRIVLLMMGVFAGLGLVLASAGIYGVLSCLVTQRQREIGIRLALGATRRSIGRLILGGGLGLTTIGLAVGLGAALALVRVMRTLLYDVEPSDPLSIAIVAALLFATAALSAWRPARRAMRVDPLTLLREE